MMNYLKNLILFRLLILVIQLKKADYDTKIYDIEQKINDYYQSNKDITTQEFNKLMLKKKLQQD